MYNVCAAGYLHQVCRCAQCLYYWPLDVCAAGYLHQVRSYGRSISLTVKFAPSTSFDDNGCKLIEEEFLPLTEASFTWTFTEGRRVGTHNMAKSV